ncbi:MULTISPECIES: 4a-hydroxytetrahydrobiopterin dehydratase [unclassified Spirillospora]|uniref:4a-hydroxytetrahydrobiopterin dehydratase n=1 Tax=unclassified Spirillospora TaxID=2642701 RepID=UPI0037119C37
MFAPPAVGGGVTGPAGQEAPLTPEEVDAALGALPDWSGDTGELRRTLVLPPGNLDRVLRRIDLLREEMGRGPEVRRGADGVQLAVRTASVEAVTALDVELASRLDEAIDEAGAGMSS